MASGNHAIAPPPIVQAMSLREWIVGCIVSNPSLTGVGTPEQIAQRVVALADEMMLAMRNSEAVTHTDPPNEDELQAWQEKLDRAERPTNPATPSSKSGEHEFHLDEELASANKYPSRKATVMMKAVRQSRPATEFGDIELPQYAETDFSDVTKAIDDIEELPDTGYSIIDYDDDDFDKKP